MLVALMTLSDGADIGCVRGGIAGHALDAAKRAVSSWRDDTDLEDAMNRVHLT